MPLNLREDFPEDLDPEDVDANWKSLYDLPTALTVLNGVVTVNGQGRYTVDTEGAAATDEITQIMGLPAGQVAYLQAANASRQTTLVHGASLRLDQGISFTLDSLYTTIKLRSYNGTVVYEEARKSVP